MKLGCLRGAEIVRWLIILLSMKFSALLPAGVGLLLRLWGSSAEMVRWLIILLSMKFSLLFPAGVGLLLKLCVFVWRGNCALADNIAINEI